MVSYFSRITRAVVLFLLFTISFTAISSVHLHRDNKHATKQFKDHATIIADDIWALNQSGVRAYLQLVVHKDYFKYIKVTIPGEDSFIQINGAPLMGLSKFFMDLRLIHSRQFSEHILYLGENIGTIEGVQHVRVVYPLINILLFMLLILFVVAFILSQLAGKRFLQEQVEERTRNLRRSEQRYHNLVNLLPEIVLETDFDANIVYANKQARVRK